MAVFAGAASAGPTYRFVGTTHLSDNTNVASISCITSTNCIVVGSDLARTFDGQTATPIAGFDSADDTHGIGTDRNAWASASCTTEGACMIFGTDALSLNSAYRASPTSGWTRVSMPLPTNLPASMDGSWQTDNPRVSCASATFCLATANWGGDGYNILATWRFDGATWHLGHLNIDPDAWPRFLGVSCWGYFQCIVVGERADLSGGHYLEVPFRAVLDGDTWHIANLPHAAADTEAQAVSCWAPENCIITGVKNRGNSSPSDHEVVVAWWWNGTEFTVLPGVTTERNRVLNNLSCTSAQFCVTTGVEYPSFISNPHHAYVLMWDGSVWTAMVIHVTDVGPGNKYSVANGVSCTAADACRLVGTDDLADHSKGASFLDTMAAG